MSKMATSMRRLALAGIAAAAGCGEVGTEAGAEAASLGQPEVAYSEAFAVVQTVREMPDGRVLAADPLAQVLVLVDMDAGTADTLGAVGQGPDEYQQPDAVWPLPGGKTLLVDLGNARLTEMSADLEFGDTRPYMIGELDFGRPPILALPSAVDSEGRVYVRGFGDMTSIPDSVQVLRLDLASDAVDSMATVKTPERRRTTTGSGNNQSTSITQVPLSPVDAWGVAEDGRVVVARSADYRVEWLMPDGSRIQGLPVPYEPIPIGQAEKEDWQAAQSEAGGGMSLSVTAIGGAVTMQASRGGPSSGQDLDQLPWPETLPPFYGNTILVDPRGRAWVRAHVGASGAPPAYDLFGPSGDREERMELLPGRRIVAFGDSKVYVVRMDDLGMQFLERYALP